MLKYLFVCPRSVSCMPKPASSVSAFRDVIGKRKCKSCPSLKKGIYTIWLLRFAPALNLSCRGFLVVEKADVLLNERDAQLLGRLENGLVVLATTWRCDVLDS